jgi:anti-anti-sigma factor
MPDHDFTASAVRSNGLAVIELTGDINALSEAALNEAYREAETLTTDTILLDFAKVDYINSTGIALIVGLLAEARKSHRTLVVSGLSDHYAEIFRITRLSDFMTMYPDRESALAN